MPVIQTIKLPTFLPTPADQLQKLLPPNHDSTSTMLGLVLAYLKHMHPAKLAPPSESMRASAHIINLFLNDPLIQSLLPKGTPANTAPIKELTALQIRLTSLENTLANLAKATTEARKEFKSQPHINANPAKPTSSNAKGFAPTPTYAAKAAVPQRPSVVVNVADYTWADDRRPSPSDLCTTINAALDHSKATQVRVSAARWTAKGNLVFWGGTNTTAHQLTSSIPHFSEALQTSLLAIAESAPETPPTLRPNVKWSKIRFNAVPTGKTDTRGAYTPDEVHNALVIENPAYAALTITQKPSWVRDPSTYSSSAISSFSVSFEDPDGTSAQTLLRHKTFYAFGHVATVKRWKQSPPKRVPSTPTPNKPTTTTPRAFLPTGEGSHLHSPATESLYQDPSLTPSKQSRIDEFRAQKAKRRKGTAPREAPQT
jgi:hypothetical protein